MDEKGAMPKTMFEKIWDAHAVREAPGESTILYIDRHLRYGSLYYYSGAECPGFRVHPI